jgi:uncharacterized pyridoxamine 5'-phosphate oxidase family protein
VENYLELSKIIQIYPKLSKIISTYQNQLFSVYFVEPSVADGQPLAQGPSFGVKYHIFFKAQTILWRAVS